MRTTKRGTLIPDYSDPADIGVVGRAIEKIEDECFAELENRKEIIIMENDIPISQRKKNGLYLKITDSVSIGQSSYIGYTVID